MTRSKAVIFAVFVAFVIGWLITDHSAATWIAVAVMVVSMAAGAWYARRHQAS